MPGGFGASKLRKAGTEPYHLCVDLNKTTKQRDTKRKGRTGKEENKEKETREVTLNRPGTCLGLVSCHDLSSIINGVITIRGKLRKIGS